MTLARVYPLYSVPINHSVMDSNKQTLQLLLDISVDRTTCTATFGENLLTKNTLTYLLSIGTLYSINYDIPKSEINVKHASDLIHRPCFNYTYHILMYLST